MLTPKCRKRLDQHSRPWQSLGAPKEMENWKDK